MVLQAQSLSVVCLWLVLVFVSVSVYSVQCLPMSLRPESRVWKRNKTSDQSTMSSFDTPTGDDANEVAALAAETDATVYATDGERESERERERPVGIDTGIAGCSAWCRGSRTRQPAC